MCLPVPIDHPEGTVNVAPPGVTRGASADTRSGVDLASCDCGVVGEAEVFGAFSANVLNARKASRAVRYFDI